MTLKEGGGGVNTPTGTECNIVIETNRQTDATPSVYYETDEEEFTRPGSAEPTFHQQVSAQAQTPSSGAPKCKNTAKRKVKSKACPGYNFSYLSMWWKRMDREGKKEEEERKSKEEEAKRRAQVKRWLGSRKEKLKEKRKLTNMKRLGQLSPGEGGDYIPDVQKSDQHPEDRILLGGRDCEASITGERGPGGVEGMGVVTDNVIYERSQPKSFQRQINEQHQEHGTDQNSAVSEVSMRASERESNSEDMSQH